MTTRERTIITVAHTCDPTDEVEMEALKLRAALKRSVTAHDEDLKVLYEQVAGRYPAAVRERVPLKSILPTPEKRCPVCLGEKKKPHYIVGCGHTYCKQCAEVLQRMNQKDVACAERILNTYKQCTCSFTETRLIRE